MPIEIIGNQDVISIENVEEMLRAVIIKDLPLQIDTSRVNWRLYAEQAIAHAEKRLHEGRRLNCIGGIPKRCYF